MQVFELESGRSACIHALRSVPPAKCDPGSPLGGGHDRSCRYAITAPQVCGSRIYSNMMLLPSQRMSESSEMLAARNFVGTQVPNPLSSSFPASATESITAMRASERGEATHNACVRGQLPGVACDTVSELSTRRLLRADHLVNQRRFLLRFRGAVFLISFARADVVLALSNSLWVVP